MCCLISESSVEKRFIELYCTKQNLYEPCERSVVMFCNCKMCSFRLPWLQKDSTHIFFDTKWTYWTLFKSIIRYQLISICFIAIMCNSELLQRLRLRYCRYCVHLPGGINKGLLFTWVYAQKFLTVFYGYAEEGL